MKEYSQFMAVPQSCNDAVAWITGKLMQAGLAVHRTFDLQSALQDHPQCPCPIHGADQCDCQMVVLMVYQQDQKPVAITAHGYNHQTWFSFVDTPQQCADPYLERVIRSLTGTAGFPATGFDNDAQA